MELWDAYKADGALAGFDLIRGEKIPVLIPASLKKSIERVMNNAKLYTTDTC